MPSMKTHVIELVLDEELGGFTARVPGIPAYGEGETMHEAINDLKDAIRGYVETFGHPQIPHPTEFSTANDFVRLMKSAPRPDDDFFDDLEKIHQSQPPLPQPEHH